MTPPNLSIILIMLCFWVTLWLVNRYFIRPINAVLDQRSGQIDGAQETWATTNAEMLAATAQVEERLVEAARGAAARRETIRAEANQKKQAQLEAARNEAERQLQSALAALARDAESARSELRKRAEDLAGDFVHRLLGREVVS
jgi:F-type H+-transporting ATPase subunit b